MSIEPRRKDEPPGAALHAPPPRKAAYRSPLLQVYGSVSKLTLGTGGSKADATNMTKLTSDPACKQQVERIGVHPLGIGLYLFHYRPEYRDRFGHGRQFGVMADEVEAVLPAAVSRDADGLRRVDYAMLGVRPARG